MIFPFLSSINEEDKLEGILVTLSVFFAYLLVGKNIQFDIFFYQLKTFSQIKMSKLEESSSKNTRKIRRHNSLFFF